MYWLIFGNRIKIKSGRFHEPFNLNVSVFFCKFLSENKVVYIFIYLSQTLKTNVVIIFIDGHKIHENVVIFIKVVSLECWGALKRYR